MTWAAPKSLGPRKDCKKGIGRMGSIFGHYFTLTTFGESHGAAVGVIVDGVPPGLLIQREDIQADLDKRRPGTGEFVTARKEADQVEILSGLGSDNRTLGTPMAMVIFNKDARSRDYSKLADKFRPGHADFTYFKKYGVPPQPGGGRASGRETAARVAAGAVAKAVISAHKIDILAYTIAVGPVTAERIDEEFSCSNPLRFADPGLADKAEGEVRAAKEASDSVGGVIEVRIKNVPPGWGDPVFYKLEAVLGQAMLSIGAVKGIEFGAGFELARMRGSEANDPILPDGFASNRAGGTLGGISTGQDIVMRLAVKPTASIGQEQQTVTLDGEPTTIQITGRHDPFLCPRIAPVAEAMAAIVLADAFLEQRARERV
jgi:chorismate synthase